MKLSECYDAEYVTHNYGRADRVRPAITAKRARLILDAAKERMDATKLARVNKSITVGQAFEILSNVVTPEVPDETILHSLVSRNIVREFGRYL